MKTVEYRTSFGYYKWIHNSGYKSLLDFAQRVEDNHYIVQEIYRTGKIRVKLPEWFVLKRNQNNNFELLTELTINFDKLEYIHIGKYSMYLKEGYFKDAN